MSSVAAFGSASTKRMWCGALMASLSAPAMSNCCRCTSSCCCRIAAAAFAFLFSSFSRCALLCALRSARSGATYVPSALATTWDFVLA